MALVRAVSASLVVAALVLGGSVLVAGKCADVLAERVAPSAGVWWAAGLLAAAVLGGWAARRLPRRPPPDPPRMGS